MKYEVNIANLTSFGLLRLMGESARAGREPGTSYDLTDWQLIGNDRDGDYEDPLGYCGINLRPGVQLEASHLAPEIGQIKGMFDANPDLKEIHIDGAYYSHGRNREEQGPPVGYWDVTIKRSTKVHESMPDIGRVKIEGDKLMVCALGEWSEFYLNDSIEDNILNFITEKLAKPIASELNIERPWTR